jgi:hypothetical protein
MERFLRSPGLKALPAYCDDWKSRRILIGRPRPGNPVKPGEVGSQAATLTLDELPDELRQTKLSVVQKRGGCLLPVFDFTFFPKEDVLHQLTGIDTVVIG